MGVLWMGYRSAAGTNPLSPWTGWAGPGIARGPLDNPGPPAALQFIPLCRANTVWAMVGKRTIRDGPIVCPLCSPVPQHSGSTLFWRYMPINNKILSSGSNISIYLSVFYKLYTCSTVTVSSHQGQGSSATPYFFISNNLPDDVSYSSWLLVWSEYVSIALTL